MDEVERNVKYFVCQKNVRIRVSGSEWENTEYECGIDANIRMMHVVTREAARAYFKERRDSIENNLC